MTDLAEKEEPSLSGESEGLKTLRKIKDRKHCHMPKDNMPEDNLKEKRKVGSIDELPEVMRYLERIGAQPRSMLGASIQISEGRYHRTIGRVKFTKAGEVEVFDDAESPSEAEAAGNRARSMPSGRCPSLPRSPPWSDPYSRAGPRLPPPPPAPAAPGVSVAALDRRMAALEAAFGRALGIERLAAGRRFIEAERRIAEAEREGGCA